MTPFRWILLSSLYVTQFLGIGFFFTALIAILRREGIPLEQLGVIYLLGFVWVVKVLWAPLVDRLQIRRLGHYRGWLIVTQIGMVIMLLVVGLFDPVLEFWTVLALCLVVTVLAATQDVAADGLACRLLSPANRSLGGGVQFGGGMAGNVIGGGGVLILYPMIGWMGCMIVLAAGVALPLALILWFREPVWQAAVGDDQSHRRGRAAFGQIWRFWQRPGHGRWMVMLMIYPLAIYMTYSLITPILVDAGWSLARIGLTLNVAGSAVTMLTAIATGWAIRRIERRNALIGVALLQGVGLLALLLPASGATEGLPLVFSLAALFTVFGTVAPVLVTLMMDRTAGSDSPGTDFTVQYSLYGLVGFASGALALPLATFVGYQGVIVLAAGIALVAAATARAFYRDSPTAMSLEAEVQAKVD